MRSLPYRNLPNHPNIPLQNCAIFRFLRTLIEPWFILSSLVFLSLQTPLNTRRERPDLASTQKAEAESLGRRERTRISGLKKLSGAVLPNTDYKLTHTQFVGSRKKHRTIDDVTGQSKACGVLVEDSRFDRIVFKQNL